MCGGRVWGDLYQSLFSRMGKGIPLNLSSSGFAVSCMGGKIQQNSSLQGCRLKRQQTGNEVGIGGEKKSYTTGEILRSEPTYMDSLKHRFNLKVIECKKRKE